jgi:hypothetical protein
VQQLGQLFTFQNLGDKQHGVSPGQASLEKLVTVENKIFPEQRNRHPRTNSR